MTPGARTCIINAFKLVSEILFLDWQMKEEPDNDHAYETKRNSDCHTYK